MNQGTGRTRTPVGGRRHAAIRLLPHLGVLVLVGVAAGVGAGRVSNPDTYFHLRFGEEFWGHWSPWHPGSVTRYATREWLPTQWLTELVMGRFDAWFGLPGVAWLTGLGIVALVGTLYLTCRSHAGPLVSVGLTGLALVAAQAGLSGRPQLVSYLLITVVVGAWLRTSTDGRPRWWLVPIAWIWPLLHGMWPLGIVISAVAAVGVLLDRGAAPDRRASLRLLGVPVAMAVASAVSLLGPGIYAAVLLVGSRRGYYSEWAPPDFTSPGPLFVALLLALLVVALLRVGPTSWFRVLMLLLCCAWAAYSSRTVPVAAVSAAPLAAMVLGERFGRATATHLRDRALALAMVGLALVVLAGVVPFTADQPRVYPAWVDPELGALPRGTGLLVYDYDGSYLIWRHPQLDVVAHGYGDAFTGAELARNDDLYRLSPDWEAELRRTGIQRALLPDLAPLTHALESDGWRIARVSDGVEYLVGPSA